MTNSFWVALVALTALALAFVLYPLFFASRAQRQQGNQRQQGKERQRVDRQAQNLDNYRQRLAELEADRDERRIDPEAFATLKDELDAVLLEDVAGGPDGADRGQTGPATAGAVPDRRRGERRGILAVVLIGVVSLPILAFGLYDRWGFSEALVQAEAMRSIESGDELSPQQLEQMLVELRTHLQQNPDNADGWALLGRTNMQLQRYQAAAEGYQGLAQALGEEPIAATAWGLVAQARYLESQRQWNDSIMAAIEKARAINPDEVNSLGLLGISAFERQNFARAAAYWTRILQVAPNYPQYESIANGVASAYRAMNEEIPQPVQLLLRQAPGEFAAGVPAPIAAEAPEQPGASVEVRVSLAEDLPAPDPGAAVFVFARAVAGPPMPLAVARLTVSDLPATVTLDDSQAMTPQARLSGAERVILGARISVSGSATPGPGDLEGASEPVAVGEDMAPVTLTIDRQRP